MNTQQTPRATVGVDTGGTFTDFVLIQDGICRITKLSSTPEDPSRAVLAGVRALPGAEGADVVHGTTVALNALLTGRKARTALVTGKGFLDLIEIGRQSRPDLYELSPSKPAAIVPRDLRFEVDQRTAPLRDGTFEELSSPSFDELEQLTKALVEAKAESLAICLLHSYATPEIEERIAKSLAHLGLPTTCSARILPEYREFERFSTACINASLVPLMQNYLTRLESELEDRKLELMQSSGGTLSATHAAEEPVRILFSGPAGGVIGAARAATEAGFDSIVALDMGGTSTDVAFHSGESRTSISDAHIAGHPIAVPALDIHTIGTGGGSLVSLDNAGILHVGPESAAADPGPVCYGNGETLTVTDAHVMLGHIATGKFAAGEVRIDEARVQERFESLSKQLGVGVHDAAQTVLDVARAAMRRALGVMTMQRGQDPKALPLVAFGGAGGLQAAALASSLEMRGALIPANPGVLSAWGMANADALCERSRSVLAELHEWDASTRSETTNQLLEEAIATLQESGHPAESILGERTLDLRYCGQNSTLSLVDSGASPAELARQFHSKHESLFGWQLADREVELVSLRIAARVPRAVPKPQRLEPQELPSSAVIGQREAWFGSLLEVKCIDRTQLEPGMQLSGPALIEEYSGTGIVPPNWKAEVLAGGHLWLTEQ